MKEKVIDALVGWVVLWAIYGLSGVAIVAYKLARHGGFKGWLRAEYGTL